MTPHAWGMIPRTGGTAPRIQILIPRAWGMTPRMRGARMRMRGERPRAWGALPQISEQRFGMRGAIPHTQIATPQMQGAKPQMQFVDNVLKKERRLLYSALCVPPPPYCAIARLKKRLQSGYGYSNT